MGIHGEPGVRRAPLESAHLIVKKILDMTLADLDACLGERFYVLVNGLGATPLEELYIVAKEAQARLVMDGLKVSRILVGEFATSLEMAGMSISLLRVDDELETLLSANSFSTPVLSR